jgi:hypothetical protein
MTTGLRIADSRRKAIRFRFDGADIEAFEGETVAVALLAAGMRGFAVNMADGSPRGIFCAMGTCQECAVLVDDQVREACRLRVSERLDVKSQR